MMLAGRAIVFASRCVALLVAFASYQVDAGVIANCRRAGADDRTLVEITSWAAMAAARWQGGLLPMPD